MSRNRNNSSPSMEDHVQFHAKGYQKKFQVGAADATKHAAMAMLGTFEDAGGAAMTIGATILKSLATTGVVPVEGTQGADALKTQDLINEIQSTELSADRYAPTWKWINKKPTKQDILQLTEMSDYGGDDALGFIDETAGDGGLASIDFEAERKTSPVKWLGQQGQVMRTALVVEALGMSGDPEIGNVQEVAEFARLEKLTRTHNYGLWHFDNSKNVHEFNGMLRQIEMGSTPEKPTEFNMNNNPLTPENLAVVESFMYHNGGHFTDMFAGVRTYTDLKQQLIPFAKSEFQGTGVPNVNPDHYKLLSMFPMGGTQVDFHIDPHLDASPKDGTHAASGPVVKPTSVGTAVSSSDATNKWGSVLAPTAEIFYYAASAVNTKGESIVTAASGGQSVANGEKVVLTIARADTSTKFYYIYRGTSASNLKLLDRVKCTGANTTYEDRGDKVPGTANIVFLTNEARKGGFSTVMWRSLWPFDKLKLPIEAMSERFAWLSAGSVQLLQPRFNIVLRNVGVINRGDAIKPRVTL